LASFVGRACAFQGKAAKTTRAARITEDFCPSRGIGSAEDPALRPAAAEASAQERSLWTETLRRYERLMRRSHEVGRLSANRQPDACLLRGPPASASPGQLNLFASCGRSYTPAVAGATMKGGFQNAVGMLDAPDVYAGIARHMSRISGFRKSLSRNSLRVSTSYLWRPAGSGRETAGQRTSDTQSFLWLLFAFRLSWVGVYCYLGGGGLVVRIRPVPRQRSPTWPFEKRRARVKILCLRVLARDRLHSSDYPPRNPLPLRSDGGGPAVRQIRWTEGGFGLLRMYTTAITGGGILRLRNSWGQHWRDSHDLVRSDARRKNFHTSFEAITSGASPHARQKNATNFGR